MRKTYLDNIRWATVLLVLIYHVFFLFNSVGAAGALGNGTAAKALDAPLYFIYPWFMVLLFLIAGISARYSLQTRSNKQFIRERAVKLLVPSTLGLFVYHWIGGYLNIKIGGGLEYIPKVLIYPISAISGIGPLWFIQTLFLFSLLLVLIRKLDSGDRLWAICGKANTATILLFVFPIWGAAQIGNLPLLTMYRFGIYGLTFLLGYFVFSHDKIQDTIEKIHIPMLILAIILGAFYTFYYFGTDYTAPHCLQSLFTNIYLWAATLAVLGCGKAWFNGSTRFFKYIGKSSYGLYILHYPVVLTACWFLQSYYNLPMGLEYIIALFLEFLIVPCLYELLRRIPVVRYLMLGIKSNRKFQN